jgi:hypothetical protein
MKYVYGIAPTAEIPAALSTTGLSGATLEAVKHNGVTAIVSDAVPYDYAGLPKQQLVKVLAQHQQAADPAPGEVRDAVADDRRAQTPGAVDH